jgi:type IV secretion system protein VirD4
MTLTPTPIGYVIPCLWEGWPVVAIVLTVLVALAVAAALVAKNALGGLAQARRDPVHAIAAALVVFGVMALFLQMQGTGFLLIVGGIALSAWRVITGMSPPPPPRPGERILQRHATGAGGQLGGSRLMDASDVIRAGLCRNDGAPFPHIGLIEGVPIVYPGDGHLLTVAAAGSGKSSGPVAVNLIVYPGSIVATDPKGELAQLTAHWRAEQGVHVHVVDPWGIVPDEAIPGGVRATFNPLDLIPGGWDNGKPVEGPDSIDNAYLLADAILMQGSQAEPHWDRTAKALISGLLLAAALDPEWTAPRTLTAVNDLLALPPDPFREVLAGLGKSPIFAVAAEINQFLDKGEREASGVRSTVNVNMRFLQGEAMRQALGGSSLDWKEVKRRSSTVYLCIPPARLTSHAQFLRLMFSTALASMETPPPRTNPDGTPWRPVLFLMDEFANLGRVEKISEAYALMRGYGIKLWAFVQDFNQLKHLYGERWETFVGNAGVIQAFGTRDVFTSDYLSKLSGDFTQRIVSTSGSQGTSRNAPEFDPANPGGGRITTGTSQSQTTNESYSTTPLLYPSDIRELPASEQILIIDGKATIQWRVQWFRDQPYAPHRDYLARRAEVPVRPVPPEFAGSAQQHAGAV